VIKYFIGTKMKIIVNIDSDEIIYVVDDKLSYFQLPYFYQPAMYEIDSVLPTNRDVIKFLLVPISRTVSVAVCTMEDNKKFEMFKEDYRTRKKSKGKI
jgi:hypothetical protein